MVTREKEVSFFTTEATEVTEPDRKGKGWIPVRSEPFLPSDLCVLCALCGGRASQQRIGSRFAKSWLAPAYRGRRRCGRVPASISHQFHEEVRAFRDAIQPSLT